METPHSAGRPHVGTDPVSVRTLTRQDEILPCGRSDRIGMGIGQTRGLSLHVAYRPSGSSIKPNSR